MASILPLVYHKGTPRHAEAMTGRSCEAGSLAHLPP